MKEACRHVRPLVTPRVSYAVPAARRARTGRPSAARPLAHAAAAAGLWRGRAGQLRAVWRAAVAQQRAIVRWSRHARPLTRPRPLHSHHAIRHNGCPAAPGACCGLTCAQASMSRASPGPIPIALIINACDITSCAPPGERQPQPLRRLLGLQPHRQAGVRVHRALPARGGRVRCTCVDMCPCVRHAAWRGMAKRTSAAAGGEAHTHTHTHTCGPLPATPPRPAHQNTARSRRRRARSSRRPAASSRDTTRPCWLSPSVVPPA